MKTTSDVNTIDSVNSASKRHWGMHLLEIEITYQCNLQCLHCYNRYEQNQEMPLKDIVSLIETASDQGVQKLIITGGEACLHSQFEQLCSVLTKRRREFSGIRHFVLQTNGHSNQKCTDDMLRAFDIVHISYDLDDNPLRPIKTRKQVDFITRLKQLGIHAYFFVTLHKGNINRIDEIIQLGKQEGIPLAFNLCSNNEEDNTYLLSRQETIDVINTLIDLEKEGAIRPFKHPFTSIIRNKESEHYVGNRGGCTAGIASCVVKANGDVISCPFLRVSCGNIYNQELQAIWASSEIFAQLRNRRNYTGCGECKHLSYCGGCRKSALDTSGSITGYDATCILADWQSKR